MKLRTRLLLTLIIVIIFALLARAADHAEAQTFGTLRWLIPFAAAWFTQGDARTHIAL
jgi:hypothetical protein